MSDAGEQVYVEVSDLQAFLRQAEGAGGLAPGIALRPASLAGDEEVIAELVNTVFGFESQERVTGTDVAGFGRHPGLASQGIFLAFDGSLAVGVVIGRVDVPAPGGEAHRGAVELLAVRTGYRQRGIGRQLIYQVFSWLAEQQVQRVGATAQEPRTVDILKSYGFRPASPPGL